MSDEQPKPIDKLYQVLSLTLHSDGTTTLTLDADVEGVRQVVHMPGGMVAAEIEQLMQENATLKERVAALEAQVADAPKPLEGVTDVVDVQPEEVSA